MAEKAKTSRARLRVAINGPRSAEMFRGLLRQEDIEEFIALTGKRDVQDTLEKTVRSTFVGWHALDRSDRPVLIGGWSAPDAITGAAQVWLVGTDLFDLHYREVCRRLRPYVRPALVGATVGYNWVDHRNTRALRFAEYLGATIEAPTPRGPLNHPFHRIILEA